MKRFFIISLMLSLLLPVSVGAQTMTNKDRRYINSKVLTLIEEYERYATLYDDEAAYYFRTLFVNETSTVHCDMIASAKYRTQVPVDEYIALVRENSENTTTVIKDVKKGEMVYANGVWDIPVTFRKTFSYIDGNGYLFSVEDWHKKDFDMTMNVIYDPETDACLIQSITGRIDSDRDFPTGRFIIVNENEVNDERYMAHFSSLKINDQPLEFNEFGQAIVSYGEASVDDMDVVVDTVLLSRGFNYDVVSYDFNPRKARIKLRYGYSPEIYKAKGISNYISMKSPAQEIGLDFGFAFPAGRNAKMGLYAGVGAMMSSMNFNANKLDEYVYSTARRDEAGLWQDVTVKYSISSAEESAKYLDLFVPVYFELEHRIGNYLMLSWNLGAKAYYNLKATPGEHAVSGKAGSDQFQLSKTFSEAYYKKYPFDFSAFGNIGLDVNLVKKKMYLMVRAGYEYGITPTFKSGAASYYVKESSYVKDSSYPVIYDKDNKNVLVHPMISGLEISRQGWWFSGGLKFKL